MARVITVLERQTLYDIALQEFGSVEGVTRLVADNPGVNLVTPPEPGTKLVVNGEILNRDVFENYKANGIKPVSLPGGQETSSGGGDFNNDFNNDFG